MSYCVNCGVELADSEKYCPLCNTEVINPRAAWKEPGERPYPQVFDQLMRRVDRHYLAALISTFLLIPALVTALSDWLSGGGISWSLYVWGAALLMEVWFVAPLLFRRYHLLTFLALDCLAAMAYLLAIDLITATMWFVPLALPISLAASLLILFSAWFFRRGRGRRLLFRMASALMSTGIMAMVVEAAVDMYVSGAVHLGWSPFVLSPCLVLAVALMILESKKSFKEEIKKRMFY